MPLAIEPQAWLIFCPDDNNAGVPDDEVKAIARAWMSDLPGARDLQTETIDTMPTGKKVYRVVADVVAWRAWQKREGWSCPYAERPPWVEPERPVQQPTIQRDMKRKRTGTES